MLGRKERWIIYVSLFLIIISGLYLSVSHYLKNTKEIPAYEGEYTEGMIGVQNDILMSDDSSICLRQLRLDENLVPAETSGRQLMIKRIQDDE